MLADSPDWFLQAWVKARGKKQADLAKELGWPKNQAYRIWHSKQPYRRDYVNQLANWLEIEPYELLMPPEKAMLIRQFEQTAYAIAAEASRPFERDHPDTGASTNPTRRESEGQ